MEQVQPEQRSSPLRIIGATLAMLAAIVALYLLFRPASGQPGFEPAIRPNLLALTPVAFLAGVLSFLSPCTLPVLPAYFAFTFGTAGTRSAEAGRSRGRVLISSLAFFGGLATTMVILGASFTAIGQIVRAERETLMQIGGVVIIIFGAMSLLGKGFAGPNIQLRRSATIAGAYLYGLTFALGWTACIGPTLGVILTLLTTQGGSLVAGAGLSFIYALGLGLPLILVATFFGRLGQGTRAWRVLRGRGWELHVGGRTLYLHSTGVISGLLMIAIGLLLVTGELSYFNRFGGTGLAEWGLRIEDSISRFFGAGN